MNNRKLVAWATVASLAALGLVGGVLAAPANALPNAATVADVADPDAYTCNLPGYIGFEDLPDGTNLSAGAISGVQFTTTGGFTWLVGDFATNLYNGKFPAGDFTSHGTHWAWLGVNQGSGRIDFVFGKASQFSVLVSDLTPVVLEAYNSSDVLLATAGPAADNTGTGHMAELKITRATADIAYVVVHDSGNFFEIDDVCTDAPGVNVPVRQGSFTCRAVTGRLGSGHYGEANAALDPCKDDAKWSSTLAIGTVASLTAVQAVTSQTPDDLIANLPAVGDNGSAFASAGTVIVRISGVRIAVAAVSAAASARCNTLTSPTLSTASQVVGLSINGGLARTVTGPLTINVGLVKIELNKTTSTPTSRTRQALVVSSLLTPGKLVIGEATAGFVGNPCTT